MAETRNHSRLQPILGALTEIGLVVEPVLYSEEAAAGLVDHLCRFDAVLVWVDPISADDDRVALDALLRDVASNGPWVSAHPDTIMKMGTKEVLYRTGESRMGRGHAPSTPPSTSSARAFRIASRAGNPVC